jgi:hypothetical protein
MNDRLAARFTKSIQLWIPRKFISSAGLDAFAFIADVNRTILNRGYVLSDGQILTTPILDQIPPNRLLPQVVTIPLDDNSEAVSIRDTIRLGPCTEILLSDDDSDYDEVVARTWGNEQRSFFALQNPYQMAEDAGTYTWSWFHTQIDDPYLSDGEQIIALLHGHVDNRCFYCPCHSAEIVYTTRHRLVCMACGALHAVFAEGVDIVPKRLLSAAEWVDCFDDDGPRRDEAVEIAILEFRAVENLRTIWTTSYWDESTHEFIFLTRSSEEEIADAMRRSGQDASLLREMGWTQADMSPPPAYQLAEDSIDVDLVDNAALSLKHGVSCFLRAKMNANELANAIPSVFRAVELLLKARLHEADPSALDDQPNNPTVLNRLATLGVIIPEDEKKSITQLRRLRNHLQHGEATFNYRAGRAVCKQAILFLNKFAWKELSLWIGDAVAPDELWQLLQVDQVMELAEEIARQRLQTVVQLEEAAVSKCDRCNRETMVRPHPSTGAACWLCGYVAVVSSDQE